jgi:serine/threonine protein kinase
MRARSGLEHLHSLNVLHLDIKPANVLVGTDEEHTIKIGDFGQSILKDEWSDGSEGDSRYMAPELLLTGVTPSTAADMFSLGMLLLEIVTGSEPPNGGPQWQALRHDGASSILARVRVGSCGRVSSSQLTSRSQHPNLDADMKQLIIQLLCADPEHRPSASQILARYVHKLDAAGTATPPRAPFLHCRRTVR